MTELPFPVRAGEFEGPLDLLLALTRSHEVRLEDIPIAEITGQYLRYLKEAEAADIPLDGEFVYMAATLIQIKSRGLLPVDPALRQRGPDPRAELVDRLREHAVAKEIAQTLRSRMEMEEFTWSKPGMDRFRDAFEITVEGKAAAGPARATLADLIDTLGAAVQRAKVTTKFTVEPEPVTVEDRLAWFRSEVALPGWSRQRFWNLITGQTATSAVCLFLALLEMARLGEVSLEQSGEDVSVGPVS